MITCYLLVCVPVRVPPPLACLYLATTALVVISAKTGLCGLLKQLYTAAISLQSLLWRP